MGVPARLYSVHASTVIAIAITIARRRTGNGAWGEGGYLVTFMKRDHDLDSPRRGSTPPRSMNSNMNASFDFPSYHTSCLQAYRCIYGYGYSYGTRMVHGFEMRTTRQSNMGWRSIRIRIDSWVGGNSGGGASCDHAGGVDLVRLQREREMAASAPTSRALPNTWTWTWTWTAGIGLGLGLELGARGVGVAPYSCSAP